MARRKGFLEQIAALHREAARERARRETADARVRAAAEKELKQEKARQDKKRTADEAEAERRRRAQEREARAAQKAIEAKTRAAEVAARRVEREVQARTRARERAESAAERDRLRAVREAQQEARRVAADHEAARKEQDRRHAEMMAEHVQDRVRQLERVLQRRVEGGISATSLSDAAPGLVALMDGAAEPGTSYEVLADDDNRRLLVVVLAPGPTDVVPEHSTFKVSRAGGVAPVNRPDRERRQLYRNHLARLALRALRETFDAVDPDLLDQVWISVEVNAVDPATGQRGRRPMVTSKVDRALMDSINLDAPELDPAACVETVLRSRASRNAYEVEAVAPFTSHELCMFNIPADQEGSLAFDSRTDLLQMRPTDFEYLVRDLFLAMGLRGWHTTSSNDAGVDAVVVDPGEWTGGEVIVQAKRYSKAVERATVHELLGVMGEKHATRAILVTTAWIAPAGRRIIDANPRLQAIEGPELCHLVEQHLGRPVTIRHERVPRHWQTVPATRTSAQDEEPEPTNTPELRAPQGT
ncbi:restriction endonuclease [Arsenicicoccus sp. oral taxon 190]|uniref:restriction endonuclease n=1 Tax=Arsenicicoccus sp. oral taxon 190 TaxID=1658671 RepID=UPI00067A29C2|nr:restriction endonuclease [Arsenicicoccus sp. oral taxon 190]AKT51937.1 hypothetical protein ADJ73_12805 [Arsenicicoccus sp. oral taxon 190]